MDNIGIDLGSRKSQVCISCRGKVVKEFSIATRDLGHWLGRQAPARVLTESCAEAHAIAEQADSHGHTVFIVPSSITRQIGVGARRQKNDIRDARALANYGCRIEDPASVHRKSLVARQRLELLSSRKLLLEVRGDLVRRVKSKMRERLLPPLPRARETFTRNARELFVNHELGLGFGLEMLLDEIDSMDERIQVLTDEIKQLCKDDEAAQRLMSVPGVGPQVALCFMAVVDTPERFGSSEKLANYLGLTPGESTTGFKRNLTGITKAGHTQLRALLVQAAWSMFRTRKGDPVVQWAQRLAERRGNKSVAIIALARKLAGILLKLWKSNNPFDPSRAALPAT